MNYRPKPTLLLSYKLMIFEKRSNNSQIDYLTSKNIFELSLYCFFSRCMVVTSVSGLKSFKRCYNNAAQTAQRAVKEGSET